MRRASIKSACLVATTACFGVLLDLAHADSGRPAQPVCLETTHFVIHCDTPGSPPERATQAATDLEEAYGRLVTGGGLSPNAGLRSPVADDDGKTDVYVTADAAGGIVYFDHSHISDGGRAAFILMSPDQSAGGFRFRAGHEFMHVLQMTYFGSYLPYFGFQETLANWAAEWSLPDVDPLNSNFDSPELPFDCTYGTWPPGGGGKACGNGYNQWLFFQRQAEDYGVDFIRSFHERARSAAGTSAFGLPALKDELAARTGLPPDQALGSRFDDYARKIWDPFAWSSTAVYSIFEDIGPPRTLPHKLKRTTDTGVRTVAVDHLAANYVEVSNPDPHGGDRLRLTVTPPEGLLNPPDLLVGTTESLVIPPDESPRVVPLTPDGAGNLTATVPSGPADPTHLVIALVNDTTATDGLRFSYRAELLRFKGKLSVPRQGLAAALKHGLEVDVSCNEDCAARVSLKVSRSEAERLGLAGGGSKPRLAKSVTIGKAKARLTAAGAESLTVKFARRAKGAISRAGGVRLTAKGKFSSAAGARDASSDAVRLKR